MQGWNCELLYVQNDDEMILRQLYHKKKQNQAKVIDKLLSDVTTGYMSNHCG